jgi:hypothetical protein
VGGTGTALRRAALIVCVMLGPALGAESAVAAPAPVPCSPIGGGKHECSWWRLGDGRSGGAIVVNDGKVVGYLHQGRNWIECQQEGAKVYNEDGNKNNWYGWTTSDYGGEGWASALDAKGGDDYGEFEGVPNCDNDHGPAPGTGGLWGTTPPGGTPTRPETRPEGDGRTPEPADPYEYPDGWRVNEGRRTSIPAGVHNRLQCAYGPFWPESKHTGGDVGVRYCWQYGGNRIYVRDTIDDKAASAVYYKYTKHDDAGVDRDGICINSHGTGTWATCQLRVRGEKRKITLYGALLDRDRNHLRKGLWSCAPDPDDDEKCKEPKAKSDYVSTEPVGIKCAFAHKRGELCNPVAPDGFNWPGKKPKS